MSDEQDTISAWEHLTAAHQSYLSASAACQDAIAKINSEAVDRVALLRYGLRRGGKITAFQLAEFLTTEEKKELLNEWVLYAIHPHSDLELARRIIKSLPRDWLLENIETAVEPLLQEGGADAFYGVLDFYVDLDFRDHFARLADRATRSSDPSIHEVGEQAIKDLQRGRPA